MLLIVVCVLRTVVTLLVFNMMETNFSCTMVFHHTFRASVCKKSDEGLW
jgi:hypothetical protein